MKIIDQFHGPYRFLSNFWGAKVTLDGVVYPTVEHAYQAAKTLDAAERENIRAARAPNIAKRMGRSVTLRPDWEQVKVSIMLDLLRQKFRDPRWRGLLLDTGAAELVEGNYWGDTFWGVCNGGGLNQLGLLLMQVRSELAREEL